MKKTDGFWAEVKMLIYVCDELPDDAGSWDGWCGRLHNPDDNVYTLSRSQPMTYEEVKDRRYKYFDKFGGI